MVLFFVGFVWIVCFQLFAGKYEYLKNFTLRHGVKIDSNASEEDVCLAVGDVVSHENMCRLRE